MKVKFKKLRENSKLPVKAHETDACYDVYASEISIDRKSEITSAIVKLGFATAIEEGFKGVVVPRSSLTKTNWIIINSPGQIDPSYRGEWQIRFKSIHGTSTSRTAQISDFPFSVGDRVGQIYFEEILDVEFEEVDDLDETDRGEGGFGSTGIQ